jgi:hypothetical protein
MIASARRCKGCRPGRGRRELAGHRLGGRNAARRRCRQGTPLLFLTKGLAGEGDRLELLPHRLRRHLTPAQQRSTPLLAVGGPSIAGELAEARDTCVVVTGDGRGAGRTGWPGCCARATTTSGLQYGHGRVWKRAWR